MDASTLEMILTAYEETVQDALGQGRDDGTAHREGVTAAAMCLASVTGAEDSDARAEVEGLDLRKLAA